MKETSKLKAIRKKRGDFEKYLVGNGIDVGAGDDLLTIESEFVRSWDINDGDATELLGVADETYDFVYSSHCLEHLEDVPKALSNWVRVLKPGGYLYIVVPDYVLYEKMMWPSVYNTDHRASFSMSVTREMVKRENHHHIKQNLYPLLQKNRCISIHVAIEDYDFDYNAGVYDQTQHDAVAQICIIFQKKFP